MTEDDYINATNVAKAAAADTLLRDTVAPDMHAEHLRTAAIVAVEAYLTSCRGKVVIDE